MARISIKLSILLLTVACGATDNLGTGGDDEGDGMGIGTPEEEGEVDDGVLPTYPTEHPRIYLTPHRERLEAALAANTPTASKFRSAVERWANGENIWGFQAWNGALLSQLSGNAAYCTKSVAVVEAQVVAAEAAMRSGGRPEVALDSYLEIGEDIGDLALVYDWCFEQVTPAQRERWIAYANQAVWNVWHPNEARWGNTVHAWSGWSVNNPSNNYYYSFLRATMLLGLATKGENPEADGWIAQFRDTKIFGELIPTFEADLVGGGSREGTGYGVSMRRLFELYQFWKATTGESLATKTGHTRASLLAFMHQTVPTLDKVAPTGDHARDASAAFFDYHRDYLEELIALFPKSHLAKRAKTLLAGSSIQTMSSSFMVAYDFLNDPAPVQEMPLEGLNTAYYAEGIGELYARSGWDKDATWMNLIAGPYTESHAHQDQGSLMVYKGGWLVYDANIESKSGLAQATTAHSLVRIDEGSTPIRQVASTVSTVNALAQGEGYLYTAADLTPAYKGHAAIQKVNREIVYLQPNVIVVFDRVQSAAGTNQTWQLATPVAPAVSGNSATITNAGHSLQVTRITPTGGAMSVTDLRSVADMEGGYRLDERMPGGDHRYLHVLALDGSVAAAAPAGATGVDITLADGGTAQVTFDANALGGASLTLNGQQVSLGAQMTPLTEAN